MSEWIPQLHFTSGARDGTSQGARYWSGCGRALDREMVTDRPERVTCQQCRSRKAFKALVEVLFQSSAAPKGGCNTLRTKPCAPVTEEKAMSEKRLHRTARLSLSTSIYHTIRLPAEEGATGREHWSDQGLGTLCGTDSKNRTLDPSAVTCKRCRADSWFDGERER